MNALAVTRTTVSGFQRVRLSHEGHEPLAKPPPTAPCSSGLAAQPTTQGSAAAAEAPRSSPTFSFLFASTAIQQPRMVVHIQPREILPCYPYARIRAICWVRGSAPSALIVASPRFEYSVVLPRRRSTTKRSWRFLGANGEGFTAKISRQYNAFGLEL